jgi:hypothetical protein
MVGSDQDPAAPIVVDTLPQHLPEHPTQTQASTRSQPRAPNRSRETRRIVRLYATPEPLTLAEQQVAALVWLCRNEYPETIGADVPQKDLERCLADLCRQEGWPFLHWTSIGRVLAKVAPRHFRKVRGNRERFYQLPRRLPARLATWAQQWAEQSVVGKTKKYQRPMAEGVGFEHRYPSMT